MNLERLGKEIAIAMVVLYLHHHTNQNNTMLYTISLFDSM